MTWDEDFMSSYFNCSNCGIRIFRKETLQKLQESQKNEGERIIRFIEALNQKRIIMGLSTDAFVILDELRKTLK